MKDGLKTTELWVTVIAGLITLFNKKLGLDLDSGTIMALAGLVAAYAGGRSVYKAAHDLGAKKTTTG